MKDAHGNTYDVELKVDIMDDMPTLNEKTFDNMEISGSGFMFSATASGKLESFSFGADNGSSP